MTHFKIKEWDTFQHYKDRSPPWIKLHREILSSRTWVSCSDSEKALAIACMLLAALNDNKIPNDPVYIKRVCYLDAEPNINKLAELQFIEFIDADGNLLALASAPRAKRTKRLPREEKRRVDQRREDQSMSGASAPDDAPLKTVSKKEEAAEVLSFLNLKANRAYQPTDTNLDFILARFKEGYTASQCRKVIVRKCRSWLGDDEMAQYLRPSTLFNREKFNQYVGELVAPTEEPPGGFLSEMEIEHGSPN